MPATTTATSRSPSVTTVPRGASGEQARERLLLSALRLFADKGFAKTSTREIAQAAGANLAAIRYYFGDKAGLYQAAFTEPMGSPKDDIPLYDRPELSLQESMEQFIGTFLAPLELGDGLVDQCMRLHFREMLEPTAMWQQEVEHGIRPAHQALVRVLCRHLGLRREDDEVHRLAFAIVALPMHLYICRDLVDRFRPALAHSPGAIETAAARLTGYAVAMVEAEARRRRDAAVPRTRANRTAGKKGA